MLRTHGCLTLAPILLLAGSPALLAAEPQDPWESVEVQRAVAAWAQAEAQRLAGEPGESARGYGRSATLARHALAARGDKAADPILQTILRLSLSSKAQAETAAQAPAEPVPPEAMLRRLAEVKARGDSLTAQGHVLEARLAYHSFLAAGDLFRRRYPNDKGVEAVRWLRGRVERSLAGLPAEAAAPPEGTRDSVEQAIREAVEGAEQPEAVEPRDPLGLTLHTLDAGVRVVSPECAYSRLLDAAAAVPSGYLARVRAFDDGLPPNAVGRALAALGPYATAPDTLGQDSPAFGLAKALGALPVLSAASRDAPLGTGGAGDLLVACAGLSLLSPGVAPVSAAETTFVAAARAALPAGFAVEAAPAAADLFGSFPPPFGVPEAAPPTGAPHLAVPAALAGLPLYAELADGLDASRPDALALGGLRGVVAGLRSAEPGTPAALAPDEGKAFLEWLLASDVSGDIVAGLADALSRSAGRAGEGAITMGAQAAAAHNYRRMALEAYLAVLQQEPERDPDGRIVLRTVHLAAELGRLRETSEQIAPHVAGERPGLLGVVQFRLLVEQKRADEAYALLGRMADQAERFLPANPVTAGILTQGFAQFIADGRPEAAERTLQAAERIHQAPPDAQWLALAQGYARAGQPDEARRVAEHLLGQGPDEPTAVRARALLVRLRREPGGGRPVLTAGELALLAEEARIDPRRTVALAEEYRRAGMFAQARQAYGVAARRFRDLDARAAIVGTWFDEGRYDDGAREAEAFLADHHGTRQAEALFRSVTARLLERDDLRAWAGLCRRLAASDHRGVAACYARQLAELVVKARRGGGTPCAARAAPCIEELAASPQWPLLQPHIRACEQDRAGRLPAGYQLPED